MIYSKKYTLSRWEYLVSSVLLETPRKKGYRDSYNTLQRSHCKFLDVMFLLLFRRDDLGYEGRLSVSELITLMGTHTFCQMYIQLYGG